MLILDEKKLMIWAFQRQKYWWIIDALAATFASHQKSAEAIKKARAEQASTSIFQIDCSLFAVTFFETINTATGIQHLVLAGVKRMRSAGNFNLHQWVFVTVFPLDGFLAFDR